MGESTLGGTRSGGAALPSATATTHRSQRSRLRLTEIDAHPLPLNAHTLGVIDATPCIVHVDKVHKRKPKSMDE